MTGRARSSLIATLAALVLLLGLLLSAGRDVLARPLPEPQAGAAPQAVNVPPSLALPALVSATAGQPVDLPLTFDPGTHAIDTIFFVLSYDATLLTLDETDANGDGVPDSITVNLPAGYRLLTSLEISGGEGRLEVLVDKHISLTESLSPGTLLTVTFDVAWVTTPQLTDVTIPGTPAPFFVNTKDKVVPGNFSGGTVDINQIPTLTPTPSRTPTATATPSRTPTATATTTPTPTATPSRTPTATITATPTATATATNTSTPTPTPTATASATPTPISTATATATSTTAPTATATATPTATGTTGPTPTATATPTATGTPTATSTATTRATPTATSTTGPTPTATATGTPTATPTITRTPTATATPAPVYLPALLFGASATPTATATRPPTATPTATATRPPTATPTATATRPPAATATPTPTATRTPKPTVTATSTATATTTPSATPTASVTPTPSVTPTASLTPTPSRTPTASPTAAPVFLPALLYGASPTPTPTPTATATATATATPTATNTRPPTATPTASPTGTPTRPPTITPTPSRTPTATATATRPPDRCVDLIANGGFEGSGGWQINNTVFPARIVAAPVYSGLRALQAGIVLPADNVYSYSSAQQTIFIPAGPPSVALSFQLLATTTGVRAARLTPPAIVPTSPLDRTQLSDDVQMVLLFDSGGQQHVLLFQRQWYGQWQRHVVDLSAFRGQAVTLYFGVFNNGVGGITGMAVDEVAVTYCLP